MTKVFPDPIVAIATAPGRGAVGIIRLSGAGLLPLVNALLGRSLKPREATYLAFPDAGGRPLDFGLAIFFPAPHSFTGEDVLELQAHGGPVVLQLLLRRCLEVAQQPVETGGAETLPRLRLARPGEFTERAFLNDKMDLAQAESVADLIDASTEAAARSATRSLAGAFSEEVAVLLEALTRLRMLVEATLDFPEEDIDFLQQADAGGQLLALQRQLLVLLQRTHQGALLREGINVVLAGQPNAGKSSLLNALAGAELAIVTPIAGTTRDKVQQTVQIEGVPLHVIDTAGLRETEEEIERLGVQRAWGEIATADVVLFVHDLGRCQQQPYQQSEQQIEAELAKTVPARVPIVDVWNKRDLCGPAESVVTSVSPAHRTSVHISALTGEGLDDLRQTLLHLVGWKGTTEGVFIARDRHLSALRRVQGHLELADRKLHGQVAQLELFAEELRLAQMALGEITGMFTSDDLLGAIFSSFCIGK
jgi:tRNA modification GTPase